MIAGSSTGSVARVAWRLVAAALAAAIIAGGTVSCGVLSVSNSGHLMRRTTTVHTQTATQIARRAITDLGKVRSVHIRGTVSDAHARYWVNLRLVRGKGCSGRIAKSGQGSVRLIKIGNTLWFKPDSKFLHGISSDPAALGLLSGKYLKARASRRFGDVVRLCRPGGWVKILRKGFKHVRLVREGRTRLAGRSAVRLTDVIKSGTMYVSLGSKPELLRLAAGGNGSAFSLEFTGYGHREILHRPPASKTLDGGRFGV
jgi:hypothetical protein